MKPAVVCWRLLLGASLALNAAFLLTRWWPAWQASRQPRLVSVALVQEGPDTGCLVAEFATPMVADPAAAPAGRPLGVAPALDYAVQWRGLRTAVLHPAQPITPGRAFSAEPVAGLCDARGRPLVRIPVRFVAGTLALLETAAPERLHEDSCRLSFRFNGAVSPGALAEQAVVSDAEGRRLTVAAEGARPTSQPTLRVEHPSACRRLHVVLPAGLRADGADVGLAAAVELDVEIGDGLAVSDLASTSSDGRVCLVFTVVGGVLAENAAASVRVQPAVDFRLEAEEWGNRYRLVGPFAPQTLYTVTFAKGLRATNGLALSEDAAGATVTGALSPLLSFVTDGPYLPRSRKAALPLRVANVEQLRFTAERVYPNNLAAFWRDGESSAEANGVPLAPVDVRPTLAADTVGTVQAPLDRLLGGAGPGVYRVTAARADNYWPRSSRVVVWTSLGLWVANRDGHLLVWVHDVDSDGPVADCDVALLSCRNQTLAAGQTDGAGLARLTWAERREPEETPFVVVARKGADTALLGLGFENRLDLSELAPAERDFPSCPYEALVYTERGIYRPGETVALSAVVRDAHLAAAPGVPTELAVRDPQGKVVFRHLADLSPAGTLTASFDLPAAARTGGYVVTAGVPGCADGKGDTWGSREFTVGFYMPGRIRARLTVPDGDASPGDTVRATVFADYYFGRPASDCAVEFTTDLAPLPFAPAAAAGFVFGDEDRPLRPVELDRTSVRTDAAGEAVADVVFPVDLQAPAAVQATVTATVREPGGRAVASSRTITVHPCPYYLGLRPDWDPARPPAERLRFSWTAVASTGQPRPPAGPLRYELLRDVWHYALVEDRRGNWARRWERERTVAARGDVAVAAGVASGVLEIPCGTAGQYALRVQDATGQVRALLPFAFGEGRGDARPSSALALRVTPDRERYRPGDEAVLSFTSPATGQALVCTGASGILAATGAAVRAGENRVTVRVPPDHAFGVLYAAVTVVADAKAATDVPRRQFGLACLAIDQAVHRLAVDLSVPDQARPQTRLPVRIRLSGPGGTPRAGVVQVLAVDEGILSLTRHQTPNPFAHFHGARGCPLAFADVYDRLFPELPADFGRQSAAGGDGVDERLRPELQAIVRPAVVVLPFVEVPAAGEVTVDLALPDHTGSLRIMAVAVAPDAVGCAESAVRLRLPLSVQLTAPRAVAPGDEFEVTAQVFCHDLDQVDAEFALTLGGPGEIVTPPAATRFALARGEERRLAVRVRTRGDAAGVVRLRGDVSGGDARAAAVAACVVRPGSLPLFRSGFVEVPAGAAAEVELPGAWLPGTARTGLLVSTSPGLEAAGPLAWLRQYPYGCLEQTVSAAFPMLVVGDLPGLSGAGAADRQAILTATVAPGVNRLLLMELPSGGFSMWPGEPRLWLTGSIYAAHFLAEARLEGVEVDGPLWERSREFLQSVVNRRRPDVSEADVGYALYVLSCMGRPSLGTAEALLARADAAPFVRLLAAAGLARGGRGRRAAEAAAECLAAADPLGNPEPGGLDSRVRRTALAGLCLLEARPEAPDLLRLLAQLREARNPDGTWATTQDTAMALLFLGRWTRLHPADPATHGQVQPPAGPVVDVTAAAPARLTDLPPGRAVRVESQGPGPLFCSWTSSGVPANPAPETRSQGLRVERQYVDAAGRPVTQFRQGDRIGVRLVLQADQDLHDVVLVDLLPGALEFEEGAPEPAWCSADESSGLTLRYVEKRDDRVLVFGDVAAGAAAVFAYPARVVSRGRFMLPAVSAEAMYQTQVRAYRLESRTLDVE